MAEEGTFCDNSEVKRKAGANVSSTSEAEEYTNQFIKEAEAYINAATGENWTDQYDELDDNKKYILKEAASNLAAVYVINYDYAAIASQDDSSRIDAENRINVLFARFVQCMDILTDVGTNKFLKG
ncbi:MAG: hypothetical protein ACOCT9_02290 [archaeon]